MYRRTTNSTHYLPRQGSHSTKPRRNGRVDVLPPGAAENLYSIADQISDCESKLVHLGNERNSALARISNLRSLDRTRRKHNSVPRLDRPDPSIGEAELSLREIEDEMKSLRKHVGSLKSLIGPSIHVSLHDAFERVAKAELDASTYESLMAKAKVIVMRAGAKQ